ncbi:MAG: AI-2E family transporter [Candidatus Sericytochromatia bacterium]
MPPVTRTLIVNAPVDRVYQWWARMENLPQVLPHVREVKRTGPFTTHWRAEDRDGQAFEWEAEVVQDMPQRSLEWESRTGPLPHRGHVDFEALAGNRTRLRLTITETGVAPRGTGLLVQDLDAGLERFRDLIEARPPRPPLAVASPYRDLFYRAMSAAAGVLLVAGLAWSLVSLIEVWMILLGALLLAATLNPAVAWLETRASMPRGVAVAITFMTVLAGVSVFLFVLIPGIITQGQELASKLPGYVAETQALLSRLHAQHPMIPEGGMIMSYVGEYGSTVLSNVFSLTTRFIWIVVVVLSILFLALFILLDGKRLQETVVRLLPIPQRAQVPALFHTVQERIGHFMLGLAFICILAGVITWGALALMGVPYALLIGAVTTLLQAVPFVGPLFGGALATLIALSKSPEAALWTVIVYAVIQQLIGQFFFPLIMGRTLGMHPVWIVIALLVGGTLYGLVGAFVAIPIAIAVSIVLECYYFPWAEAKAGDQAEG